MTLLVDTNVLLRLDHVGHEHRQLAQEAIERLIDDQHRLRTVPQVLYEYWVVATRPVDANGLGFTIGDAQRMLTDHKELFHRCATSAESLSGGRTLSLGTRCSARSLTTRDLWRQCSAMG